MEQASYTTCPLVTRAGEAEVARWAAERELAWLKLGVAAARDSATVVTGRQGGVSCGAVRGFSAPLRLKVGKCIDPLSDGTHISCQQNTTFGEPYAVSSFGNKST